MSKYPDHCRTVDDVTAYIKEIFSHPDLRVERFSINVVTDKGGTMKLKWDRKDVGQKAETSAELLDGRIVSRDDAFNAAVSNRMRKRLRLA